MIKESEDFVKELTILKHNLVQTALRYKQMNPTTYKALISHTLNITVLINKWKEIG